MQHRVLHVGVRRRGGEQAIDEAVGADAEALREGVLELALIEFARLQRDDQAPRSRVIAQLVHERLRL